MATSGRGGLFGRRRSVSAPSAPAAAAPERSQPSYEQLYEAAAQLETDEAVGAGAYDVIGEVELDVLRLAGMQPFDTLLDFGCGNGRLAVHAVPYLSCGNYIGVDISTTFLANAERRLAGHDPQGCTVRLVHQNTVEFDLADHSIDIACAFSVFTHMEHEEMYRYLVHLRRVVRQDGTLVLSCLPLDLGVARDIFLAECRLDMATRWSKVRNVTTSTDLVERIAAMAGWHVEQWLPGDQPCIPARDGQLRGLGQSVAVLTMDAAVDPANFGAAGGIA